MATGTHPQQWIDGDETLLATVVDILTRQAKGR